MTPEIEIIAAAKLLVSFSLGAVIGYDRERHSKDAGIRTYAAVCMSATLFTFIGERLADTASVSRIVANIVTGVGFLGAGIIYKNNTGTSAYGLTTAATIWGTSAVGVAVGLDMFIVAVVSTIALYFLLAMHHMTWYKKWKQKITDKSEEGVNKN